MAREVCGPKVLITGSSGLLGAHLMVALSRGYEVLGVDRHPWWGDQPMRTFLEDVARPGCFEHLMGSTRPDIVIHCAAMANVDACEEDPVRAFAVNAQLTRALVRALPARCLVVYLSTDGLFTGTKASVTEAEPPCPRTAYGRSKLHGEWEVQLAAPHHLIIRTNFYGWSSGRKETAAEWLYHALATGRPITLFDDFFFCPIYVTDFVERVQRLIEGGGRGIVHLAGGERVSKYRFGQLMAQAAGLSLARVRRGSIDDARLAASRPKDMSLDSSRFCQLTGMDLPGCLEGLGRFLDDRTRPLSARVGARRVPSSLMA